MGKRLLIKQINKLPLHAGSTLAAVCWDQRGTSPVGVKGMLLGWKVGAGPGSLDRAQPPLRIAQCSVAQGCRGAHGWGASPATPAHRPGRRGTALAGVSGPSAGHLQCGLISQGSSLPAWPREVPLVTGAAPPTPLLFWVNWTHGRGRIAPPHPKIRKLSPLGI